MTMVTGLWPTRLGNPTVAPVFSATPSDVSIEITARCQLRCTHCFNRSGPENPQELELEVIERILDEVVAWGVHSVRISGGEPTMHRRFGDVMQACQRRGLLIAMNTNGIYSRSKLEYLCAVPIGLFMISVDGLAQSNDAVRGAGTFSRAVKSARALLDAGQRVMLCSHLSAATAGEIDGLISVAADLGCDLKVSPIRPIGRARKEMADLVLSPQAYLSVVQRISERRPTLAIKVFTDFDILDDLEGGDCVRDPDRASCKAGRTMVNINYDGRIYPCAFFTTAEGKFSAGSVHDDSISEAWLSTAFEPFRVHTKSNECQSCGHYQNRCACGCPAISHFTYGILDALDPTCFAGLTKTGDSHADE